MRKLLMILTLSVIAIAAALPGYANGVVLQGADSAQTPQTDDAARNKMYEDFLNARKKWKDDVAAKAPTADASYKAAYDIAKEYTDKYGAANDDYAKYVKKFVTDYDTYQKSLRAPRIEQLVKDKKFPEAYALGKEVLNEEPNNLAVLYLLSSAALQAEGDTYNAEAANYAKRALQLIEQGKTFIEGTPIPAKDEKLALLNYELGWFAKKNSPTEAAAYFYKAAQYESPLKKDAAFYSLLAGTYESDYEAVAKDYAAKYPDETTRATPEGKAATDKLNAVTDRLIDAYARAVSYAGTDAKFAAKKKDWLDRLTALYKFRHDGSEAGLQEFIASVTSKPLPSLSNASPTGTVSKVGQTNGTN